MTYETIELRLTDGYAELTLNRPDALNSFNTAMHAEVKDALARVEHDDEIRALLLTGAGRGFCAGQDLSDRQVNKGDDPVDLGHTLDTLYNPLVRKLASLPLPVVCAVNGVAAGAGANIALACDIVLAARSARFIQAFCKIGLLPDSGGTWILPRLVGRARAAALAFLGEPLSASDAADWGLIYRAVDDEQLLPQAREMCAHFATQPTLGLAGIKQALRASWANDFDQQLELERDLQQKLGRSADYREGVAAFLEKRQPTFRGR
ncbi:MAG: 2-(1,2-epoxy-1,2-dihydrophenyl)acetyl-CoA isomerase [Gammaproteobacteria bacterium]|nr:2-(1,2-epoxy-1,2-dihydrophenyl)acetyl-CoA isomerase [Gammaproteobacteria bacterium]NNM20761.1 2-(1,2-epoxy-1,2-dihydrophenyl)acetyl-CoA isomerase [Gammaproteobacteria bacterium]